MADRVTERRDDVGYRLRRRSHALPFVGIGTGCVVAGGMVAAVTARNPTESGTWAVAYLVLVAGVAQIALGAGQALLAAEMPPPRLVIAEFILWNCANTGVLAGTLLGVEPLMTQVARCSWSSSRYSHTMSAAPMDAPAGCCSPTGCWLSR